jgi:hypothetical protein
VDPAANLAAITNEDGIDRYVGFFTAESAQQILTQWGPANAITATNTFPHIPALQDFVEGIKTVLAPGDPKGEPQLGRRRLYQMIGDSSDAKSKERAMLWVLNLSDDNHSLLQIAEQSEIPFEAINDAATALLSRGLLRETALTRNREKFCDRGQGILTQHLL